MRICTAILLIGLGGITAAASCDLKTSGALHPTAPATWSFESGSLRLNRIGVSGHDANLLSAPATLTVVDGRTGTALSGDVSTVSAINGRELTLSHTASDGGLHLLHQFSARDGALTWLVTVRNTGADEAWLEVAGEFPLSLGGKPSFWDGHDVHGPGDLPAERRELAQTFPLCTAFTQRFGFAVGATPDTLVSFLTSRLSADGRLRYATRIVADPGQSVSVRFVMFVFRPEFGYLDAVDGYQRRYPKYFEPNPDIDPRLHIAGTDVLGNARPKQTEFTDEALRPRAARIRTGFGSYDWAYSPFKRAGDWYGRPRWWNWEMGEGEAAKIEKRARTLQYDLGDVEQFHRDRERVWRTADLRLNSVLAFYLINWIEEGLVEALGGMGQTYDYGANGSRLSWITGTSHERHIFPWTGIFEEQAKADMPLIVRELNLRAFALDNAGNANVFRGKLDRPIPGWAYDEQGRYINTGIGHRLLIEYLRSLRNNDFQLGVIGNSGDPFMVATVLDSHLTEAKDQPNLEYRKFLPQRLMWGGKPIHLHSGGGFDNPALEIDWSTLSDDEIRLFYQDHLHRWMLGCWQGGYVPSVMHIPGRESVVREMPAVLDVMSRGYRCVPACSGDTRLVRARYGKGLRSVLVVSNPTQAKIATTEFVHDAYIADGHVVPVQYDGGALTFEQRPDGTRVPLVVGRNRTALITVPMALEWLGDAADFACTGETSADIAIDRIVVTAALTTNLTRQCRISAEAPPNYRCVGITLADREVVGSVCTIPAGTATLTVEFRSELFQTPEVDLMDFPFASASIVLPAQAPARIQGASAMLNDAIVAHFGAELGLVERLPEAGAVIRIGMSPSPGIALSRDGRILSVSGATPFATQQAVAKLIRWILDRKLRYIPPFFYLPIQPTRDMLSRIGVGRDSFFVDVATSGGKIPKRLTGRALSGGDMVQPRQAERLVGHRIAGGYYADDSVLVWAFEGDGFASWKNLSVYVNADDRGSGRASVVDGCDWRLSMDRATGRGQLHRYDDIAPDADGATIVRGTHRRQLAMIEATVAQTDKCLYVAVRRDLMKRLPPIPAHRFYLLLYLEDGSNRRVTFRARPDGDAMGDAVDLGTLQARKNAEERRAELAVPTLAGKPVIDGRLDEPFWDRAARIHRLGPLRGDHVNEPTEAFLAFTDNAFVLGVRCWDSRLKYVGRSAVARDSQRIWASHDHVEVFLAPGVSAEADSYPFYQLMSNVAGSQWDGYKLSDAWNGSWQVKTSSSESCWEAEFRIPLSDLGEHAQASVWRFNVARFLSLRREWSTWAPITGGLQKPNGFGVLVRQVRK